MLSGLPRPCVRLRIGVNDPPASVAETKVVCRNGVASCAYDLERFVPALEPLPPGAQARLER